MKILLATHLFFPSHTAGTEVLTLELARALRAKGHEVTIVTCIRHENVNAQIKPWLTKEEYDIFDVFHLNFGVARIRDAVGLHINAAERVALLRELVSELSPDMVHFMHIHGFSAAAITETRKMGIPVFFTATDYWAICPRTNLLKSSDRGVCEGPRSAEDCVRCAQPILPQWAARIAIACAKPKMAKASGILATLSSLKNRVHSMTDHLNAANGVFVPTNFLAKLLEQYGVNKQSIRVVPHGVRLGSVPKKIAVPAAFSKTQPLRIIFIGSLTHIKGLHILLGALRLLPVTKLECLIVNVYGKASNEKTAYVDSLKELALPLKGVVHFMGTFPHEDIGRVLRSGHLCVVPSIWYENAPLVLCSALAAGVPVLVSKMGGMTEIIQEGINGISFGAGDSLELSGKIEALLDNTEWFRKNADIQHDEYRTPEDYANDIEAEYLKVTE